MFGLGGTGRTESGEGRPGRDTALRLGTPILPQSLAYVPRGEGQVLEHAEQQELNLRTQATLATMADCVGGQSDRPQYMLVTSKAWRN